MKSAYLYSIVVFCSLMGGSAQILLKKASDGFVFSLREILTNWNLFAGITLYGLAFIGFFFAVRYGQVSKLYPLIACSYVFVVILAWIFLNEPITINKILGSIIIVCGVWLISA